MSVDTRTTQGHLTGWSGLAGLLSLQLGAAAGSGALWWWLPTPRSAVLGVVALAWIAAAWGWALRRPLTRADLQRLARRSGALAALLFAIAYLVVAQRFPEQVDDPGSALVPIALLIGVGGGITAAGLSLCGLDLARSRPT